ncbi:MAG: DUF4351 domain-containing protein [Armatimonadota bacterium]|nr:DUF4351 domain-containing protein [Armatimonadota bacterium]
MIDHDRLFKELLTTFFVEFCELFLPEVAASLQRESLQFLDKEVFTDVTTGERHEADLVVLARWREQETCFLIHVEHQAYSQAEFGKRMFRYFARLHEKHDLPIYPVVIFSYDKPRRAEPDRFTVRFPDLDVLEFHYRVIQLNRLSWRDFVRHANPVASALMSKMQIAPRERPHVKLECLRLLATLRLDPARTRLISGFIDTYLQLNADELQLFHNELGREQPAQQEAVMQIVTSWMKEGLEQGRREGRQEGWQKGRQEGEAAMILLLLNQRIGPLSQAMQRRIRALSVEQLEELGKALFDFTQLADLRNWLAEHV